MTNILILAHAKGGPHFLRLRTQEPPLIIVDVVDVDIVVRGEKNRIFLHRQAIPVMQPELWSLQLLASLA